MERYEKIEYLPRPIQWAKIHPPPQSSLIIFTDSKQASYINLMPFAWKGFISRTNAASTDKTSRFVSVSRSSIS